MEFFLSSLLAYFVIIDPVGSLLIFNALTTGKSDHYRKSMAIRSTLVSLTLVLCFGFWGAYLLANLGIQMESFKVAGGLLIFYASFGMITQPEKTMDNEFNSEHDDISVFPLSIPLIAGPGCLTLTILQFSTVSENNDTFIPLIIAIVTIYFITLLGFLFSKQLVKFVGKTINSIFKRLLGVLLASLAIQFIADGIKGLML